MAKSLILRDIRAMETYANEIMSGNLLAVKSTTTVEEALKIMINARITGMPVVDDEGKMIGVVSEFDILKQIASEKQMKAKKFHEPIRFSKKSTSIREDTPLSEIIEKFLELKFRRLPVVDGKGKLLGIITRRDLMRVFYYRSKLT
jgi:CBS domain-containing protein